MMYSFLKNLKTNPAASEEMIGKAVSELGCDLPTEYLDLLRISNGVEGNISEHCYLSIWPIDEVKELNDAYEVNEYAPGLLLFGTDGGGNGYAFDMRQTDRPIVEVPLVGMDINAIRHRQLTFNRFLMSLE